MKRILPLAIMCMLVPGISLAQNLVPPVSWGATIPMFSVGWDETGDARVGMLSDGAGIAVRFRGVTNPDQTLSVIGFEIPWFVEVPDNERFKVSVGAAINFFNGLLGTGVRASLVDVAPGDDRGAFLGKLEKQDVSILFTFGFNVGGGEPPPLVAGKGGPRPAGRPPFNYVDW